MPKRPIFRLEEQPHPCGQNGYYGPGWNPYLGGRPHMRRIKKRAIPKL